MSRGYDGLTRDPLAWSAVDAAALPGFEDPHRRVGVAKVLVAVPTLLLAVAIPLKLSGIAWMGGFLPAPVVWAEWFDGLHAAGGVLVLLAYLVALPFFLRAQRQLQRNLVALGLRRPTPGVTWATLSWFVPLANLIVPYYAFRRLTIATGGAMPRTGLRLVGLWWLFWIGGSGAINLAVTLGELMDGARGWVAAQAAQVCALTLLVLAGVLVVALLRRLASQQRRAAMRVLRLGSAWPALVGSEEEMAELLVRGRAAPVADPMPPPLPPPRSPATPPATAS